MAFILEHDLWKCFGYECTRAKAFLEEEEEQHQEEAAAAAAAAAETSKVSRTSYEYA